MAPENALAVRAVVTARNNIVASLDGGSNVGVSDPAGEQSKLEEAAEEASGKPISGRQSCKIRRFDSSFPQVPFAQLHALVAQQKTLQQSKSGGPPTDTRHLGSQKSILCSTPLTADKWKAAPEDEDIYISRTDKTSLQHVLDTLITRIQVQLTNIFPIGQQEVLPRTTLVPQDDNTPPDPQALDARSQEHRGHEIEERDAESKETAASTNSTDSGVGRESQMVGEGKLDGTEESSISRGVTQTKESQRAGESEDDVERETNVERRCVVDQYSLISVLLDSATRRIASTLSSSATERTERDQSLGLWWLDRSSSLWVGSPSEIPSTGAGVEQRVLGLQRLISGAFCQLDVNQDSLLTSADFSLPRMEDRSSAVGTGKVALGKGLDETEDSEQDLRLSRSLAFDPLPSQGGGFTQNFSELTAAVQELCGLDSRLHSSSLLSLCHWDRYRLYEACWAQDTSVGGGGSVRGWLAQQGHRSFIQMGDVVRRRKSSVKTKLDPILSSEMTLCGVCGKPSRLEDLFALRCRHYACSVCWRVQLKLMETKGETRVPCAAILRTRGEDRAVAAPCLATGDLDFVLRLSGEETTKKLHKERMSTYETEFHSIVSHDFNQRKQVPFVYPPGLLEHVHCRLCTDSRSGWNETEQDVGGSDTGKNLAGLDLRLTPTELSLDYTDSSTGTASAGDRVLTHFMERASRLLEKRESQDSAPLEEEELNTINTRFHLDNHHAEIRQFVQPKLEECRRLMLTAATDTHFWSMQHRVKLWRLILAGTYVYDHAGLDHLPIHPCSRHLLTLLRDQVTSVSARLTGKTGGPDSISTVEARRLQSALRGLITRVQEVWGTRPVKAFPFFSQSEDRGDSGHQSLVRHTPATGRQVIQGNTPCQSLYTADTIEFPDFLGFGVNPLIDVTARTLLRENSTNMIARADAPGEESLVARDCHALVDLLRGYPQLPAASVVSTLSSLHSLLSTTVAGVRHTGELAQTGLCPLLLAVLRHHVSSLEVCLEVCKLTQRLTDFNPVNCTLFIEADLWSVLPPVVQRHAGQFTGRSSVCVRCCKIMAHVLSSNDSNKRLSMRQLEVQPVFPALLRVLESEADEEDPSVCLSAIQATVCALDKDFTADSAFLRHGVCEVLLCRMMAHQEVEGMKVQFAIAVGRLASSNRFMQERLLELEVLEFLASLLLQHSGAEDAKLVKWCCWAVGCLVSFFPAGQTRFAALGGCKGICYAIQSTNDLNALTYVLRAMSSLALQNQYVQQCFEREETVAVLGEKRRHLQRLAQQAASYDFRSRLNLLLLTYDYALDSVGLLGQGEPGTGLFGDAGLLSADHE